MSYFPAVTKKSNIKKFFAICSDGLKLEDVEKGSSEYGTRSNLVKIMVDLLSEEEAKSLLKLAETYDSWKDEILADNSLSNKDGFLKRFYRDIFPMIIKKDFFLEIARRIYEDERKKSLNVSIRTRVDYDTVRANLRADFLRYFISWEKPVQPSFSSECLFEAFNNDCGDKINNFKFYNISEMYSFAATVIRYSSKMPKFLLDVSTGLFHNIDFLKVALDKGMLNPRDYFDALKEFAEKENVIAVVSFSRLDADVRKKIAEILFTNEAVRKVFDEYVNWYSRREFYDIMVALDPDYELKIIKMIFEKEAKVFNVEFKYYIDFFVGRCHDFRYRITLYKFPRFSDWKNSDEFKHLILETFLNEKVFKSECYKKMPKFLQHIAVIEQVMSIYGKAEVLPETKIDKEEFNKEVDQFFAELKIIAKNGQKPSDYCSGKPREFYNYDNSYELRYMGNSYMFRYNGLYNFTLNYPSQDSKKVYLTSLVFHIAVSFLQDCCGVWKAVKPMLAIFRNFKEQAFSSIEMKRDEYGCYPWDFISFRLTQILGSLDKNENEAEKVSVEWFNHLAKQLKSADEIEVKKREENPETVSAKFENGYDINVIEPHPLWRETYCKAAGDLGVNLGAQNSVFNYRKKEDKDESVREAAAETFNSIGKIKGKFDSSSRKRALLNAWWWYRVSHFISLGLNFDYDDAWEIKLREVKTNYPQYFDAPKPVEIVKKSQS